MSAARASVLSRRHGVALLVALAVVTLLGLWALLWTLLARADRHLEALQAARWEARQHALFALDAAVEQLQRVAGPDGVTTAPAASWGAQGHGWTGARAREGGEVTWLVSQPDTALEGGPQQPLWAWGDGGEAGALSAPLIAMTRPGGSAQGETQVSGRFAWASVGEAAKASLGAVERMDQVPVPASADAAGAQQLRARWRRMAPPGPDTAVLRASGLFAEVHADAQLQALLEAVGQTLSASPLQAADIERLREGGWGRVLAPMSYGVLENPVSGGLLRNLAVEDAAALEHAGDRALADRVAAHEQAAVVDPLDGVLRFPAAVAGRAEPAVLNPGHRYAPILTEAALYGGVFAVHSGGTDTLRLRFYVEAELWNPFTLPLRFPDPYAGQPAHADRAVGYRPALRLHITGLPELAVHARGPSGTLRELLRVDLDAAVNQVTGALGIHSWIEVEPDAQGQAQLRPGAVYRVAEPDTGPGPKHQPEGLARTLGEVRLRPGESVELTYTHREPLEVRLLPFVDRLAPGGVDRSYDHSQDAPLQVWRFDTPEPFTHTFEPSAGGGRGAPLMWQGRPFRLGASGDFRRSDTQFAYHVELPAAAFVEAGRRHGPGLTPEVARPLLPAPELVRGRPEGGQLPGAFAASDLLHDASARVHAAEARNTLLLWDVATGPVTSLAALPPDQALPPLPELLGAYVHSAAPPSDPEQPGGDPSWTPAAGPLPQPALEVLGADALAPEALRGAEAARHLLRRGAFNVNSVDPRAWRVVLGRGSPAPPGGNAPDQAPGFWRFPHNPAQTCVSDAERAQMGEAERQAVLRTQGARALEPATLDALAEAIAAEVAARGPFEDLPSFVAGGVFEAALAATPEVNQGIPPWSPLWLDADVLLRALAPILTTRSDTFRIRAYGESLFLSRRHILPGAQVPVEAIAARACCEAVVQRLPETLAPGRAAMEPAPGGRRFRLVAFRWLDGPDDAL